MSVLNNMKELTESKIYDLSHELHKGAPVPAVRPPFIFNYRSYHSVTTANYKNTGVADDMWIMGGHTGTHIDAIGHVSREGKLYGGVDAPSHESPDGLSIHSVDQLPIIFRRGVLLDLPRYKNIDQLPPSYEITVQDIEECLQLESVEISSGDIVLLRTGYDQLYFSDQKMYLSNCPGPGEEAAMFLAIHGVKATGSDTFIYERTPYPKVDNRLPVHKILLSDNGIPIMENLNLQELAQEQVYEFLFVTAPLKVKGGTGSPIRPFAVHVQN